MRTFLVWTLRVTISPWNSLPDFLKEPMLAMSLLLGCFEPATTAASMAICRPEAIDDAPAPRAEAQRRMAAARVSWLPRGMAGGQGKKVAPPPLRLRRSRCQPSFGQIKPLRGRVAARRTACTGEDLAGVGCRAQEARPSRWERRSRGAH